MELKELNEITLAAIPVWDRAESPSRGIVSFTITGITLWSLNAGSALRLIETLKQQLLNNDEIDDLALYDNAPGWQAKKGADEYFLPVTSNKWSNETNETGFPAFALDQWV